MPPLCFFPIPTPKTLTIPIPPSYRLTKTASSERRSSAYETPPLERIPNDTLGGIIPVSKRGVATDEAIERIASLKNLE